MTTGTALSIPDAMGAKGSAQATADRLRELLREASVAQACQYFSGSEVSLVDCPQDLKLGQVLKRYIAMVLLTSPALRIVFKVHFNPEQVRAYCRDKGGTEDLLSDKGLVDFMKELGNQMGGRICRIFESNGISMGMSIPLCTRGFCEVYTDYKTKTGAVVKFGDFWRLEGPFQSLYCSCYVELTTRDDLSGIKCIDEQSDEGELDFL
jgi:hypothetical protein